MDYQVVQYTSLSNLEARVNEDIKNGWRPLGGIQTVAPPDLPNAHLRTIVYSQAMIRGTKPKRGKGSLDDYQW
jgi:hypothetical protein